MIKFVRKYIVEVMTSFDKRYFVTHDLFPINFDGGVIIRD